MIKKTVLVFLILILFAVFLPVSSYAGPQIPPTAEGPGLILPDSPLFFLDKIKQEVRILFAFTPQNKAKTYSAIAGERLAELRFMLNKQNEKGIEIALRGVAENTKVSADSLADAQFQGQDVEKLADSLNTDIKRRQEGLDVLLTQAEGKLKTAVLGTQTSIYDSKTKVVNGLAPDKRESETRNDQNKKIETNIAGGAVCSTGMMNNLSNLRRKIDHVSTTSAETKKDGFRKTAVIGSEERKNKLIAAYSRLETAARKCVEAYSAFVAAYKELNQLLNQNTSVVLPTPSPVQK